MKVLSFLKALTGSHKYIRKEGSGTSARYTYKEGQEPGSKKTEEPPSKVEKRADGFYYFGGLKISKDPQRVKEYVDKMSAGTGKVPKLSPGVKVRITSKKIGGTGRGIIATIKEIGKDFIRIADEAGRIFRVTPNALEMAKSDDPEAEYIVEIPIAFIIKRK